VGTDQMARQEMEELTDALRTPLCDKRRYRSFKLRNGVRCVVTQDPEATFAACCANVQVCITSVSCR
jgi:secreted Zn-dependent insulinase-like peptidase